MKHKFGRRSFIKKGSALGAATVIGSALLPEFLSGMTNPENIDISVVQGSNYFNSTIKAVEMLGSMGKFVPTGSKVGLLINSDFEKPGAYVNSDITIAVVKMCFDAGAKEVNCLQYVYPEYWERSQLFVNYKADIDRLKNNVANTVPAEFTEKDFILKEKIDGAISLKDAEIIKALFECDVFINSPISKHHFGTFYTGALKNMMGVCTRKTNITYHLGSGVRNDPVYLGQCIADINLARKSDLIVVDSTEFLVTNGPGGPGDISKHDKVVAGTDIVAVDALCCNYLGYKPEEIISIKKAYDLGLGEIDYTRLNVIEISI